MRSATSLLFVVSISFALNASAQHTASPTDTFQQRVNEYVALHRRLEAPLPPEIVTFDIVYLLRARLALATAIRTARQDARQGDIFSPAIARHFRKLVADEFSENPHIDMLALVEDENTVHLPARVNGDYPAGRSISMMPPCLLRALPPLPPELRYEFVGRDLILWDVHAGLIVDFVSEAIPQHARRPGRGKL